MYLDYHIHSNFSDDSVYPMEDIIKKAIERNIDEICFTEHVDYGVKIDVNSDNLEKEIYNNSNNRIILENCNYKSYISEFNRCNEIYREKIKLKLGAEFGIQTHTVDKFKRDFDRYNFDFIILSCHQVGDKEFYTYEFQNGKTQEEFHRGYYQEILDVIKIYKDYSVLGHLDLIKRYDKIGELPFEKVEDIVTKILKLVIKDGKGIEVNTSNFRYGLSDLTPSRDILRLYKTLGGEILTIGSDSHREDHLGYKIQEVEGELRKIGFTKICSFDKMKPKFHKL